MRRRPNRKKLSDWIILGAAIVVGILIAVPFLLIVINSFKSPADYNTGGPLQLPTHLDFGGIVKFWNYVNFPQKLWNSIFIIWTWNEFLIPLTFLVSNSNQTVPVAISVLQGDRLMDVTTTSASALLGLLPTLIFFLIFQRTLTRGITAGAVK